MAFTRGQPPPKPVVRLVVALVLLSQGAALFGDLVLAEVVDSRPGLLIALNPRNRNLTLATNQLDAVTYYVIGFCRLVASDPLYYLLGFWYGERAIAWTERRSRTYGPLIREGEDLFRRASYPLIFMMPNNIICAMSAATGVSLPVFIALNLSGTVTRLIVIRQVGEVFASPLARVVDFIGEYRVPILIISAIAVAWTVYNEFFAETSETRSLVELGAEGDEHADSGPASNETNAHEADGH